MENGLIALVSVLLLGIVIYAKLWWDGSTMSLRFTKWYFGLFLLGALIVGGYFYITA
ncbi:hypothetical protein [Paenibacillus tuaregi]|uniref:hypothetical protein n=1 Tax=Paenibacillus tuaregi TaxID=1816681 RepID=UPI001651E5C1|nr:hypothetical protein [Paenibacillus tuaregi]